MGSSQILYLYLFLLTLHVCLELWLDLLNCSSVRKHAGAVPPFFAGHIEPDAYARSAQYTLAKSRLAMISTVYSALLLALFVLNGWFGSLDRTVAAAVGGAYNRGVVFILALSAILSLLQLPLGYYATFHIEQRFGFNRMTLALWIGDIAKNTLMSALLVSPLLYGLFWFMDTAGQLWWIYAFLFVAAFQFLLIYVYPILIAPIFNKFTPIAEGDLKRGIEEMCARLGFTMAGVLVMDGSRRSAHANAHFTGFGKNKRIVLFDTLIGSLGHPEILAVLAHEIGHEKRAHIKKAMALSLAFLLPSFWILSRLMSYPPFFEAFGFDAVSYHAGLTVFAFASGPVTYFLSPLFSALSRRYEYEADRFAVEAVGGAGDLCNALLCMSKKSLSNLTPHPYYSFFHYSHPTLIERMEAMSRIRPRHEATDH